MRAEDPAAHAPRVWGGHLGGAYVFLNRLPLRERVSEPLSNAGGLLGFRYGWQVGGLTGGAPTTIGLETDVMVQGAPNANLSYALVYGFFVRHSFLQLSSRAVAPPQRVRPFFSYGLGAAQVWVRKVDGRGIGHATRLGLGLDVRAGERRYLTFTLTYQAIMMPRFVLGETTKSTNFHAGIASIGFWFGN